RPEEFECGFDPLGLSKDAAEIVANLLVVEGEEDAGPVILGTHAVLALAREHGVLADDVFEVMGAAREDHLAAPGGRGLSVGVLAKGRQHLPQLANEEVSAVGWQMHEHFVKPVEDDQGAALLHGIDDFLRRNAWAAAAFPGSLNGVGKNIVEGGDVVLLAA